MDCGRTSTGEGKRFYCSSLCVCVTTCVAAGLVGHDAHKPEEA
jgi:hypothetical protein